MKGKIVRFLLTVYKVKHRFYLYMLAKHLPPTKVTETKERELLSVYRGHVLSDCNSFPRIKQSVLSDCNSFPRIGQLN